MPEIDRHAAAAPEAVLLATAPVADIAAVAKPRLEWLDLYRGLAVLVMIEAHVVNTLLVPTYAAEPWRANLNYCNGLVAPAFLFIAGFAHGLGLRRKRAVRARAWPRLRRLAGIAGLGYAMHFPIAALARGDWSEAWRHGTQMDVLACLAFSIGALVVVERVWGRAVQALVALGAVVVVLAAPALVGVVSGPRPLVAALNASTGSLFPLFPWAAFVFCGFLVSQRPSSWRGIWPWLAGALLVVAILGRAHLTATSAAFFCERLAWVVAFVPLCAWLGARWSPDLLLFAGRESLVLYLSHLAMLEVVALAGRNHLGLLATAALYPVVLAGSCAVALFWRWLTVGRGDRARRAARPPESSAPAA